MTEERRLDLTPRTAPGRALHEREHRFNRIDAGNCISGKGQRCHALAPILAIERDAQPSAEVERLRAALEGLRSFTELLVSDAPATDEAWTPFVVDWLTIDEGARAALPKARADNECAAPDCRKVEGHTGPHFPVPGDGTPDSLRGSR